jgi:hypothetical protein
VEDFFSPKVVNLTDTVITHKCGAYYRYYHWIPKLPKILPILPIKLPKLPSYVFICMSVCHLPNFIKIGVDLKKLNLPTDIWNGVTDRILSIIFQCLNKYISWRIVCRNLNVWFIIKRGLSFIHWHLHDLLVLKTLH